MENNNTEDATTSLVGINAEEQGASVALLPEVLDRLVYTSSSQEWWHYNRCHTARKTPIIMLLILYVVLVTLLFTLPRSVAKSSKYCSGTEFFCPFAVNLLFGLFLGAFIVSIISLMITARRWNNFSLAYRLLGILPIISLCIIILVIIILGSLKKYSVPPDPCPPGGDPCPKTKPPAIIDNIEANASRISPHLRH